jgi:adenine-specific DNA-methyltransferase
VGVFQAQPEASERFDGSANLVIEGDNLQVLKRLLPAYRGRVKMIYIDPPYNTGRDFLYPDNFRQPLAEYRREAGGDSNGEGEGRLHARWLNMMYPRLVLARDLLRDDGVLFVSIDDHEVHTLRMILDEIFGARHFVAMFPWQSRTSRQNDTDLCVQHEYVVAYARVRRHKQRRLTAANAALWQRLEGFAAYPAPVDPGRYANPDNDPRGPWKADPFDAPNVRPRLTYPITNPLTGKVYRPPQGRCWRTGEARFQQLLAEGRIVFGRRGRARPQLKVFYREKRALGETATTWLDGSSFGTAAAGTRELQALFGGTAPFSYPKPTALLRFLLRLATGPRDLVMDFFAGSGVTGHATLAQNREDGGERRFVLVQLPEPTGDPRWPTIADLTRERLRRAAAALDCDAGFRAFRLTPAENGATLPWHWLAEAGLPLSVPLETLDAATALYRALHEGKTWLLCAAAAPSRQVLERLAGLRAFRLVVAAAALEGRASLRAQLARRLAAGGGELIVL